MDFRHVAIVLGITLISLLPFSSNQGLADNRCFLENGASSESFFVSEDLPVGSTIGQIRVHGDPRPGGTITLHLKEANSPVSILPGSKNLTLRRKLDKEGIEGPSSVFVNLICERLLTLDPGFVIPVNIRVTDANDNAPVFVNAPYVLNISEVTVVGTRVLQGVHAVDADQQGPFSTVRYSVLPGLHADYFEFENELEGTLVLKKPLDYETLSTFDVNIRAQDGGEPPKSSDTTLIVHVLDADDQNPRFLDDRYTAFLPDPPLKGSVLEVKPRGIEAFDQDAGIKATVYYTFNGIGNDYSFFKINRDTGRVSLAKDVPEKDFHHPTTLVIRATQMDNKDRYALATLTISSRHMDNSIRFLHRVFYVKVSESLPSGSVITTLSNNRPGEPLKYYVSDQEVLKVFAFNTNGEISLRKKLDYEEKPEYVFKVFATDGITNDSSVVNITVDNQNEWEPRFRYPHYEFFISGIPDELVGRIEAADGDKDDLLTLSLSGNNASLFLITPSGELRLRDVGEITGVATLQVVATDSGDPPKKASVPVTVHFPGSAGIAAGRDAGESSLILAGLGAVLVVLTFVVGFLVIYIYKAKKSASRHEELPTLSTSSNIEKSNPMFVDRMKRSPSVSALGGISSDSKSRIPSPKVHPAPQPPVWPHSTIAGRVKKLSWGDDKTESSSNENLEGMTRTNIESSNLTVYF